MTRTALCKRSWMKNRKRRRSNTIGHLKFRKRLNVRVTTFLRQAFKCFWSSSSSRSVIVVHIWANVLLCGAERRKGSRTAFFMLNWILRGPIGHLKFRKRLNVRITTFLRQAFKCFWSSSSSRSVIVVHIWANVLLCGAERRKGSRTAFFYAELNSSRTI